VAKPVRVGRALVNVEVGVYDDHGRHCAQTALLFYVRAPAAG
jgi:acyl-coenzyme A thioesterase PaaI-like protein